MHLAQDNDVVYTLTPDRSDQPVRQKPFCRARLAGRLIPDAMARNRPCDDAAIDPIPIADEVRGASSQGNCLRYLDVQPFAVGFAVS